MHLVLGLVIGLVGAYESGVTGLIFGVLLGVLAAEILKLRKRLGTLEQVKEDHEQLLAKLVTMLQKQSAKSPPTPSPQLSPDPAVMSVIAGADTVKDETSVATAKSAPGPQPIRTVTSAPLSQAATATTKKTQANKNGAEHQSADSPSQDAPIDRFFADIGINATKLTSQVTQFFTSGNLVLKIGVIIIFFGVAFLLKYAAQRNMIPIELRLIGVAVSGMALLGVGWWLRRTKSGYGLVLQGGGIGILYLVIFASAKLYNFLPMPLALGVMVALVGLSCTLAVLQEAKSLAVFGITGGFLAPVLMSTGGGSHVVLFSYYALLNAGILGIAWFKAWRELNLLGFFFTFAIGSLWGSSGYLPEHFWTTEPFLLLFFVFYVIISVLFAHRQPIKLRGFIDGPLVFGLPLIVSGLQYALVKDIPYGMAFSSLGMGLFYLSLATLLWRKLVFSMHLLCEVFLALGVIFGSLAIPLALDGHWSSTIWALEGAGMVWVGVRQQRVLARHFGLLLQLAAALIFLDSVWYPFTATPFANRYFLGCLFLALAALVSSYYLDKNNTELKKWEKYFPLPLLIWGLVWWYIGGLREVDKHIVWSQTENGLLLFCSATSIFMGLVLKRLNWSRLNLALYLQLPAMVLIYFFASNLISGTLPHLLDKWGFVAWLVAFVVQYRILALFSENWPTRNRGIYHLGTMWLLIVLLSFEASWAVSLIPGIAEIWTRICLLIVPCGSILLLLKLGRTSLWPVGKYASLYLGIGAILPALIILVWTIFSIGLAGDPSPLVYIPLFNPVELAGFMGMAVLLLWLFQLKNNGYPLSFLSAKEGGMGLSVLFFFWVNSVVARSVHFFVGIPYDPESLYRSVILQAALAALWGFGALTITILAARKGNRLLWTVGAILLGMVVLKLFLVDLSGTGTIARIVSFLVVGVLMLIIGYFSPLPPKGEEESP